MSMDFHSLGRLTAFSVHYRLYNKDGFLFSLNSPYFLLLSFCSSRPFQGRSKHMFKLFFGANS